MASSTLSSGPSPLDDLLIFFQRHSRIFVITGAGISTESGIPAYRDEQGNWKRKSPITHQQYVSDEHFRKRYWSRSMVGWKLMQTAAPNPAHFALAQLEKAGHFQVLVTQNVDGLHQRAGSQHVVELHGNLVHCNCLACGVQFSRQEVQQLLELRNPTTIADSISPAPDGDADLDNVDLTGFINPSCKQCSGVLMPDVVFYGGSVPKTRVAYLQQQLEMADGVLAIGSTLTTYSSYRYCKAAAGQNKPVVALNLGISRADDLLTLKIQDDCSKVLQALAERLAIP